jgi:hypothetical protein
LTDAFNLALSAVRDSPEALRGVDPLLIYLLSDMEQFIGEEVIIHLLLDRTHLNVRSLHREGRAADLHISNLKLIDQFIAACRFPFNGIGVYSYWNHPGLHVDIRPLGSGSPRALWSCNKKSVYGKLDSKFMLLVSIAEKAQT